jgi:hypothetical protein
MAGSVHRCSDDKQKKPAIPETQREKLFALTLESVVFYSGGLSKMRLALITPAHL